MENSTKNIFEMISLHGAIAFFGGAAAYLSTVEHPKFIRVITAGIIGSFTGVVFGLLASTCTESQYIMTAVAGIGGWFGREGMEWLFALLKRIVNKKA